MYMNSDPTNTSIGRIEEAIMTTKKILSATFAIAVLSACAGQMPAPTPQDGASAGIGAFVKNRAPIKLFTGKPDSLMFVRLEGDDSSQYISTQPIASNYNKDGYIYLLNAPPGRYVAVATYQSKASAPTAPTGGGGVTVTVNSGDTDYTTYFSRDLVKATEVTVEPGGIVFMGELVVDTSTSFKDADDIQLHYFRLISPGVEDRNKFLGLMSGDYHYTGTLLELNQDDEAREKFLATTRENLGEAGWLVDE
jgi:hypothetical protein